LNLYILLDAPQANPRHRAATGEYNDRLCFNHILFSFHFPNK
jgi:hypothetical protein